MGPLAWVRESGVSEKQLPGSLVAAKLGVAWVQYVFGHGSGFLRGDGEELTRHFYRLCPGGYVPLLAAMALLQREWLT